MSKELKKILLIDDERDYGIFLKATLENGTFDIDLAFNYKDGEKMMRDNYYDVVLADQSLGDGLGIDLLGKETKNKKVRRALMTADVPKDIPTYVDKVIKKPFLTRDTFAILERMANG